MSKKEPRNMEALAGRWKVGQPLASHHMRVGGKRDSFRWVNRSPGDRRAGGVRRRQHALVQQRSGRGDGWQRAPGVREREGCMCVCVELHKYMHGVCRYYVGLAPFQCA